VANHVGGAILRVWLYKKSKGFSIGWLVFYNLMDEVREREEEEKRRKEEERERREEEARERERGRDWRNGERGRGGGGEDCAHCQARDGSCAGGVIP
jgi:hypothetical protein